MPSSSSRWSTVLTVAGAVFVAAGLFLYLRPLLGGHPSSGGPAAPPAVADADLAKPLPFDAAITTGTLPNGLRYFIRANREPQHRAELRLVVNAGSVLEDDDQRGLAHFVEHMAFNGTKRFPKHQVGAFLESVGMRFGPGVNAETGYDDTTYRVEIPTDQPGVIERALTILEDWAHQVSFEPDEIEKERGVVLEEWRVSRNAGSRLRDRQFPVLVKGSQYEDRAPIGTPESINTFKPDRLKQFYADWYRPDLMAVVAVGDLDPAAVAKLVEKGFGAVPMRQNARPRPNLVVPAQPGTAVFVAADREATVTSVSIANRRAPAESLTVGDYRRDTIQNLIGGMLSTRLTEVAQTAGGPLVAAGVQRARVVRAIDLTSIGASVREGAAEAGLAALSVERARLAKFGFTAPELDHQKTNLLRGFERAIAEKDRQSSSVLAAEYVRHVTTGEPVPGLQWEFDTTSRLLPGISLDEVNAVAMAWFPEENRIVAVTTPERAGRAQPAEAAVRQALGAGARTTLTPWVARINAASLLDREPDPGAVATIVSRAPIGVTEWTLSNGVRVVLLPTTFQADQIVFTAVAPGGLSLATDEDLVAAQTAAQAVNSMGFGRFASGDLQRWLAGRAVGVKPVIGPFEQGLSGGSTRQDLETMFQLIHLVVTSPRRDQVIFDALRSQMKDALASQSASPDYAFAQELSGTLSQHHPRAVPVTAASVDRMDLDKSMAFYKARFGDASGFTFVIAGSFTVDAIRPLVERYLASLPSTRRGERWKDPGVRPPKGVVTRVVERGLEPRSRTVLVFNGPAELDRLRAVTVVALAEVLQTRLRDALREELGGTYAVNVGGNVSRVPIAQASVSIDFTSDPARADALADRVFAEIAALKRSGPSAQQVSDVKAAFLRDFETNIRQNPFLVGQLAQRYQSGEAPESVWQMPDVYKAVTAALIQQAAAAYLDPKNYVKVTLKPGK